MSAAGAVIQTLVSRIQLIWPVFAMRLEKNMKRTSTYTHSRTQNAWVV